MRILLPLLALFVVTSCVSAPPPPPARKIAPPSPVTALPPPAPLASDWRDWPQAPGDWQYRAVSTGSLAFFGSVDASLPFSIKCYRASRKVELTGPNIVTASAVTIRTSSTTRTLATSRVLGDPPYQILLLAAADPLLDAIAFSRGRFVVEEPGQPPLVLPAWAEVGRVVEDCRA